MADKRLVLRIDADEAKKGAQVAVTATKKAAAGADKATAAFNKLNDTLKKTAMMYHSLNQSFAGSQIDKFTKAINESTKHMKNLIDRVDKAADKLEKFSHKTNKAAASLHKMDAGAKGVLKRMGGLSSIVSTISFSLLAQDAFRMADAYTSLENKIAVVSDSTENITGAINDLLEVSQNSRTSLEATTDVYQKLKRVQDRYNVSQMELLQLTETVSKAVAMSGGTAQAQNAAILQFGQALSNNFKAASQELNSLNEQAPGLSKALADGLTMIGKFGDVGIADLKKLAENGLLNTRDALEALRLSSETVNESFGRSVATMAQGWQVASDSLMVYLGQNEEFAKLTSNITKILIEFGKSLASYHKEINAIAVGLAATGVVLLGFVAWWALIPITIGLAVTSIIGSIYYFRDELTEFFTITIPELFTMDEGTVTGWLEGIPTALGTLLVDVITWGYELGRDLWNGIKEAFSGSKFEAIVNIMWLEMQLLLERLEVSFSTIPTAMAKGFDATLKFAAGGINSLVETMIAGINLVIEKANMIPLINMEILATPKVFDPESFSESTFGQENLQNQIDDTARLIAEIEKAKAVLLGMTTADRKAAEAKKALAEATNTATQSNKDFIASGDGVAKALTPLQEIIQGLEKGFKDYAETAMDLSGNIAKATESAMQGMEDALVSFVTTGKASFSDLAMSIINDLIKIQIQQSITGPLAGIISTGVSSFFGQTDAGYTSGQFSAKGNVFDGNGHVNAYAKGGVPSLSSFSGSVVDKPTFFASGGSFNNVMGEAGPEAILPLTRTASGDLGVQTTGGGDGVVTNVIINNFGDDTVETKETKNQQGGVDIEVTIRKIVDSGIKNGAFDRSNKNRYGLSPRGA